MYPTPFFAEWYFCDNQLADAYVAMSEGINHSVFNTETRTAESTIPTTIEEFATTTFTHVYNAG